MYDLPTVTVWSMPENNVEARVRRAARRAGYVAKKSRRDGLWYMIDRDTDLIKSPANGMTLSDSVTWLGLWEPEAGE